MKQKVLKECQFIPQAYIFPILGTPPPSITSHKYLKVNLINDSETVGSTYLSSSSKHPQSRAALDLTVLEATQEKCCKQSIFVCDSLVCRPPAHCQLVKSYLCAPDRRVTLTAPLTLN